jgi:hypothetical protein
MEKEEDMTELLRPYTVIDSEIHLSMCDKVACLLTNKTQEDYGITDDQMEESLAPGTIPKELYRISECVGELLEDLELDCDTVD